MVLCPLLGVPLCRWLTGAQGTFISIPCFILLIPSARGRQSPSQETALPPGVSTAVITGHGEELLWSSSNSEPWALGNRTRIKQEVTLSWGKGGGG